MTIASRTLSLEHTDCSGGEATWGGQNGLCAANLNKSSGRPSGSDLLATSQQHEGCRSETSCLSSIGPGIC